MLLSPFKFYLKLAVLPCHIPSRLTGGAAYRRDRQSLFAGLADEQMNTVGHGHIAYNLKIISPADTFQCIFSKTRRSFQMRSSPVTTECYKMTVSR